MGYVPDGMSPEQYRKLQEKEKQAKANKNFAAYGPQSFKSRSLQSFQSDLEKGKTDHLMPMMDAKKKLAKGQIKNSDIPYMQRLGSWDGSDVGQKKKWSEKDKKYQQNWSPAKFDWSGTGQRTGPAQQPKKKGAAAPAKKKNGFLGLF